MLCNSWLNSSSLWAIHVITYLPIPCNHCTVVWSASQIIPISYWLPLFVDIKSPVTALYAGIDRLKMVLLDVFFINSLLLDMHLRSTRLWDCDLTSTTLRCGIDLSSSLGVFVGRFYLYEVYELEANSTIYTIALLKQRGVP